MLKFLFFLLFSLALSGAGAFYFWGLSIILVLSVVFFMLENLVMTDYLLMNSLMSMDTLSFSLIILSIWVSVLMFYSSSSIEKFNVSSSFFVLVVFFLCLILVMTFCSFNFLYFYFYFEFSLIPTLLIIMGWGYQPERLQAGVYFLFYTLFASLPLLGGLIYIYGDLFSLDFCLLSNKSLNYYSWHIFIFLTLAFLVKMPMFFTHLWLPKAHVEAPVSGSMILAGILLKLGGFGFYRVLNLCAGGLKNFGGYFIGLSILGMVLVGYICCRLNDLKALVAYSSVAHMGLVICGVFCFSMWGYSGGILMMLSHGLASSGLFCMVNMYYERSSSRSLFLNSGLILILPLMSFLLFMLAAANMAAPPTLNLLSEILLMGSILSFEKIMLLFFPLGSYLGAVFTLFMFSFSQHGSVYKSEFSFSFSEFREFNILVLHLFPLNGLILNPGYFLEVV